MTYDKNDASRIWKAIDTHERESNKNGGCEFFTLVVKDSKGNPLGTVFQDDNGISVYEGL
jgi:hypothetical protein